MQWNKQAAGMGRETGGGIGQGGMDERAQNRDTKDHGTREENSKDTGGRTEDKMSKEGQLEDEQDKALSQAFDEIVRMGGIQQKQ